MITINSHQATLSKPIKMEGIGVHSGESQKLILRPASENSGITFIIQGERLNACLANVVDTKAAVVLSKQKARIGTIEHLMATFYGAGIDNVDVEVEGAEVPIMDGSASIFLGEVLAVGAKLQSAPKRYGRLKEVVRVSGVNDAYLEVKPAAGFSIAMEALLDSNRVSAPIEYSYATAFTPSIFQEKIAPARTYGYAADLEKLQQMGLARGSSLENAVPLDFPDAEKLQRHEKEVPAHKMLDCIGDLFLLQGRLLADITGRHTSHELHVAAARTLAPLIEWVCFENDEAMGEALASYQFTSLY